MTGFTMRFPIGMTLSIAGYILRKKLSMTKRFPLVLMLEPLHACNLTCTGCGRIREYESTIKQKLSVEECLASVGADGLVLLWDAPGSGGRGAPGRTARRAPPPIVWESLPLPSERETAPPPKVKKGD